MRMNKIKKYLHWLWKHIVAITLLKLQIICFLWVALSLQQGQALALSGVSVEPLSAQTWLINILCIVIYLFSIFSFLISEKIYKYKNVT